MEKNITDFISSFTNELRDTGYGEITIESNKPILRGLLKYCVQNGINYYEPSVAQAYYAVKLHDHPNMSEAYRKKHLRMFNMLDYYQEFNSVPFRICKTKRAFPQWFYPIYKEFLEYRKYNGIQEFTIKKQDIYFEKFALYLDKNKIYSFTVIDLSTIQRFIESLTEYSLPVKYNMVSAIRTFFHFLYEKKYVEYDYKDSIPNVKYSHEAHVPSVYSPEEIERLLNCVDRANATGKRDYAILLLASRFGLRASDICCLTFEDIDWSNSIIKISQKKTGEILTLPLSGEIGNSIIDYIKFGRPKTSYRNIFLRHISPVQPINSSSIHGMIQRYFTMAHIDTRGRKHGPHALRHSLASNMLSNETPLSTISSALGHSSISSTQIYLKIDTNNLSRCALPLLGEEESI